MMAMMTVKMVMLLVVNAAVGDHHLKKHFHPLLVVLRT